MNEYVMFKDLAKAAVEARERVSDMTSSQKKDLLDHAQHVIQYGEEKEAANKANLIELTEAIIHDTLGECKGRPDRKRIEIFTRVLETLEKFGVKI